MFSCLGTLFTVKDGNVIFKSISDEYSDIFFSENTGRNKKDKALLLLAKNNSKPNQYDLIGTNFDTIEKKWALITTVNKPKSFSDRSTSYLTNDNEILLVTDNYKIERITGVESIFGLDVQ